MSCLDFALALTSPRVALLSSLMLSIDYYFTNFIANCQSLSVDLACFEARCVNKMAADSSICFN